MCVRIDMSVFALKSVFSEKGSKDVYMKRFALFGALFFAAFVLAACGDDGSSADLQSDDNEAVLTSSSVLDSISSSSKETAVSSATVSSATVSSSAASDTASDTSSTVVSSSAESSSEDILSSSQNLQSSSSAVPSDTAASIVTGDTTKIAYKLKPFEGPLANPHKGFTVPTEGLWTFVPEFEYGPYGSLGNKAWDLVTYGSGYQQWNKLNTGKGVYDWSSLDALLEDLDNHGMGYALRVLPYTPSMISGDDTPIENYDWTPSFVYEMGAKKDTATLQGKGFRAQVPVWDDSVYLWAAKEFATALAARYDGDPRIEYIDIRSFGEWGEWHASHLDGSEMPSEEVQKDMIKHYASVFHKTQLVLPSSGMGDVYTYALSLGVTKRDDGLIGIPGRPDSLVRAYKANLPTIAENIAGYTTMLDFTDQIPGGYLKWTPERWVDAIKTAHLTYYVLDQDSDCGYYFYKDNKALADSMTHVIGYNFMITDALLSTVAGTKETQNTLNITVKNTGVAPCFFDIYMVAEFVDSTGTALAQFGKAIKIPKATFKDGTEQKFSFVHTVAGRETNVASLPGVNVALSLYESEEAFKAGKNPTVRFDNDGYLENKKLVLKK